MTAQGGGQAIRFEVSVAELRGVLRLGKGRSDSRAFIDGLVDRGWSPESAREFLATVRRAKRDVQRSVPW